MNTEGVLKLIKSPTKTHIDHNNGKFRCSPSVILLVTIRCLQ